MSLRLRTVLGEWLLLLALWAALGSASCFLVSVVVEVARFGIPGSVFYSLEYRLLPMAQGLCWLALLSGLIGTPFVPLAYSWSHRLGRGISASIVAADTYLMVNYFGRGGTIGDLIRGQLDFNWNPRDVGGAGLASALAAAVLGIVWIHTNKWSSRTSTHLIARRDFQALAAWAALLLFALLAPYVPRPHAPPDPPYNVVLISLDTLRADHLGAYGYPKNTSPNIDRLVSEGVVFDTAISQAPWTLPSHMSLFTGLYPSAHGLADYSIDPADWRRLSPSVSYLPEILAANGYTTAAFTGGGFVGEPFGFDRGFDVYHSQSRRLEDFQPAITKWIRRNARSRFFLFVHAYNTHRPYQPPSPYDRRFHRSSASSPPRIRGFCHQAQNSGVQPQGDYLAAIISQYDGELAFADHLLGELFRELDEVRIAHRTLVVFFSDHGEGFFEHGNCDHIKSLYNPLIRIPLVIRGPGLPAGGRIRIPVELREVRDIILSYLGLESPGGPADRRLLKAIRSGGGGLSWQRYVFSETCCKGYEIVDGRWQYSPPGEAIQSVQTNDFKLITDAHGRSIELYDLTQDPGEHSNLLAAAVLSARQAEALAQLEERMSDFLSDLTRTPAGVATAPDLRTEDRTLEELRSLGYIE